jgi:hypothetical protein
MIFQHVTVSPYLVVFHELFIGPSKMIDEA